MIDETPNVMIDIETMGTGPKSAVVAIGAVKFLPSASPGVFLSSFEVSISLVDCLNHGLTIDGSTVEWWMRQSDEARNSLTFAKALCPSLMGFSDWFGFPVTPIWANSPAFDCVILGSAYDAIGMQRPWNFRHELCFRTLRMLHPDVPRAAPSVTHSALSDATAQAITVQSIYSKRRVQ